VQADPRASTGNHAVRSHLRFRPRLRGGDPPRPPGQWRGELGFLAAISPAVHRLALEMSDRQANALATAIAETEAVAPEIARLREIALAGVFQIIITEAGRRTREGQNRMVRRHPRARPGPLNPRPSRRAGS